MSATSIANAANTASLIFHSLPDINWAGFYILMGGQLVLGPFHGKPACTRIELGKGVCGTAALRRETVVVPDVNAFEGHIACDHASQSEIVVPLLSDGRLVGVLDIDSPAKGRFSEEDRVGCEPLLPPFSMRRMRSLGNRCRSGWIASLFRKQSRVPAGDRLGFAILVNDVAEACANRAATPSCSRPIKK